MLKKESVAASVTEKVRTARRAAEFGRRKSIARYCAYAVSKMQDEKLFSNGGGESFVGATAAADVNAQALDFLIEGGKRDHEALGGFRLIPGGALQHIDDNPAFDFIHDLEKRRIALIRAGAGTRFPRQGRQKFGKLQAHAANDFLAADIFGEQVNIDALLRRQYDRAFHNVFELAHVAGPIVVHQELESRRSKVAQWLVV